MNCLYFCKMEKLLNDQRIEVDELLRLLRNYNADGPTRKTEKYLKDKLQTFPEIFRVISENNKAINDLKDQSHDEQPYFKQATFQNVEKNYMRVIADINSRLDALKTVSPPAPSVTPTISQANIVPPKPQQPNIDQENTTTHLGNDLLNHTDDGQSVLHHNDDIDGDPSNMEGDTTMLMIQYNDIMDLIAATRDFSSETSLGLITAHAANLDTMWAEFRAFFYQEKAAGKKIAFGFPVLLQKYIAASGKLNDLIRRPQPQNCEQSSGIQFNLPKLQLPEFNGKLSEWKRFIALFDRMVHYNQRIDHGIKIEYLKTCVRGQAAKIINHIDPNPENYTTCYDLLRNRYENKRELLGVLIDGILQLPKIKTESAEMLKQMHDTVYEAIMSIKNMGVGTENWDPLLCHILTRKLDTSTLIHYECQLDNVRELQPLSHLLKYLESRFMALQSANVRGENQYGKYDNQNYQKRENGNKFNNNDRQSKCLFCSGDHILMKCDSYLGKRVEERIEWARTKKLCVNCFSGTHKAHECKSKYSCRTCSKKHNTVLHLEKKSNDKNIKANVAKTTEGEEVVRINSNVARQNSGSVLLATIILGAFDKNGARVLLRALLDQGSQSAFISETAAQTLGLPRKPINATISGIGEKEQKAGHLMDITVFPRFESNFILNCQAIVLPKLTKMVNNTQLKSDFDFIGNLTLADPSFLEEGEMDLILGASEYAQIINMGLIKSEGNMIAQNTEFGWVLSGAFNSGPSVRVLSFLTNVELTQSLQQFFRADEFDNENDEKEMSEEEKYCEKHYRETVQRNGEGRFIVTIPFKNCLQQPQLGDSRKCAIASLFQLERRFSKNKQLGEEYAKFIAEGIKLGHIEEVPYTQNKLIHYMPHHCVFKDSTTTALRVVYNGSQRTSNFKSLNEQLAIGKVQQGDIFSLLLRFRIFRYVFTADVEKMYKQILLNNEQMDLHRFVYRFSPNEPIRDFRLKTVTFGTANAPYLAIRTLMELAEIHANSHPLAARVIKSSMYMDDVMGGCHVLDDAIRTYGQLKTVFSSACFNLRKWCSNSKALLQYIPEPDQEARAFNACVKALGISWNSREDIFTYEISIPIDTCPQTKRQLTSEIASLFDPLGWISPVILIAKNIVQKLWRDKIDWDAPVDRSYIALWQRIKGEFHLLNGLKIPRWIEFDPNDEMEIHGFCDASEVGYAAAIYLKNKTKNTINLVAAKAKVTPLKDDKNDENITIPRLELCGAILLAKLVKTVLDAFEFKFKRICLWSDSKIVLSWIKADPNRYKSFIASRIRNINKLVDKNIWYHVPSEFNSADCASRGLLPSELINHSLWWHGPDFLLQETYEPATVDDFVTDLGQETTVINVSTAAVTDWELQDIATFDELKKRMALSMRKNDTKNVNIGDMTSNELALAGEKIIQLLQGEAFHEEIMLLKKKNQLPKSNKYLSLSPFLDDNGILRVGGRLKNADLPYDTKHQILLPNKHCVTNLIINDCHMRGLHGGPKLTESLLRQRFWITNSQRTIKAVLNRCVNCFRVAPKPMEQYMGNLPESRVKVVSKPFFNTAVDYTGVIWIKMSNGRGAKMQRAYISIFVCMSTKAIHIELVSDMTAAAFIAAFRRLVARRGAIRNLYSDNGTNFVKANKILRENADNIDENEYNSAICGELAKNGTKWSFSPPGGPHFNGLAEAGVKSVKLHLKKTMGDSKLTFEELSTLLAQIEACVNSRPLCTLSTSPDDAGALTPSHFLIGEAAILPPEQNYLESKITWLSRWQRVQQMSQYFWKRWQADYLNELQMRTKWRQRKELPQIGEAFLILEENLPPSQWQTGIVEGVFPGDDRLTRVVSLKVGDLTVKRPIAKICPYPKDDNGKSILANHSIVQQRTSHKKRSFVLPIITALLTLFTTSTYSMPQHVENSVNIAHFDASPGLYFERNSDAFVSGATWNVISYFKLGILIDEYMAIENNFNTVNNICNSKFTETGTCQSIVSHFAKRIKSLSNTNSLIFGSRQRRAALDIVGNIASDLFGVLDSRSAEKYARDLSQLFNNDHHLMQLLQNHTSVVESTLNIVKHNGEELERQASHFNTMAKRIQEYSHQVTAQQNFDMIITFLSQMISDYGRKQDEIIRITVDSKRNAISHFLLSPQQVERQIDLISRHVGNKFLVPNELDIYSIGKITYHRVNDQYIFKIVIPLFKPQKYRIYEIISVPIKHDEHFMWIKNSFKYLIASTDREYYQYLTEANLNECVPLTNSDEIMCEKPNHWFMASREDCAWNLFNHLQSGKCEFSSTNRFPFWKELKTGSQFLFVTDEPIKLTAICGDSVAHKTVSGEGIMSLVEGCTVKNMHFIMEPKINFADDSNEVAVFPNSSTLVMEMLNASKIELPELTFIHANQSLHQSMINEIKKNLKFKQIDHHDIHHYGMIYIIIAIIIVAIIYFMQKIVKIGRLNSIVQEMQKYTLQPIPAPRQPSMSRHVSMPQIN